LEAAVFVLGYRGYGQSEGSPSQEGLQMDANAALQHVQKRTDVDTSKIVVVGKSLGGAVALHTAALHEEKLRAAIIENTFLGIEDMVPRMFPFLTFGFGDKRPLNFLVRNKWSNKEQITLLKKLPVLMIASRQVRNLSVSVLCRPERLYAGLFMMQLWQTSSCHLSGPDTLVCRIIWCRLHIWRS
jgi:abhydrolase domain-containing protein 13